MWIRTAWAPRAAARAARLTVACVALEPRIQRAGADLPVPQRLPARLEMDQAKDAYQELKDYFRLFDPRHEREDEIFTNLGYVDIQFLAPRIKAEMLWGIGLMDTICPPSTQFAAYNKITAPEVAGDLSRLRARESAGDAGQDLPVHVGVVGSQRGRALPWKCPSPDPCSLIPDPCLLRPVLIHLPTQIRLERLRQHRRRVRRAHRHVMLEAVLADVAQQLLQARHMDNRPVAEGVERIVGERAFAHVGADQPVQDRRC